MKKTIKKLRHRLTHEGRLTWLTLAGAAPAAIVALILLWFGDHTPKVQWTLTLLIAGFGLGFMLSAREHVMRPLQTMTNLLAALREGDYSIRARGARADDALGACTRRPGVPSTLLGAGSRAIIKSMRGHRHS